MKKQHYEQGLLYYDTPIGILCLESFFYKPAGHLRNFTTFAFPTVHKVVRGVDIPKLLFDPTPDLLEPFLQAARELEQEGVKGITGSCGFMARFQQELSAAVSVPVLSSSLMQLPLLHILHGEKARIGILTASQKALTPAHFASAGRPMTDYCIQGMEDNPVFWQTIIEGRADVFDYPAMEKEICQTAHVLVREKACDALLLECTDLTAFAAAIQDTVRVPVYDINALIEYTAYCVMRKEYAR